MAGIAGMAQNGICTGKGQVMAHAPRSTSNISISIIANPSDDQDGHAVLAFFHQKVL